MSVSSYSTYCLVYMFPAQSKSNDLSKKKLSKKKLNEYLDIRCKEPRLLLSALTIPLASPPHSTCPSTGGDSKLLSTSDWISHAGPSRSDGLYIVPALEPREQLSRVRPSRTIYCSGRSPAALLSVFPSVPPSASGESPSFPPVAFT
jgi:hypothetical protein